MTHCAHRVGTAIFFVLALAACEAETDNAWVNRQCRDAVDVPAWNECVERANASLPAKHAAERAHSDAQWNMIGVMIGGSAAGYRPYQPPAPVFTTCTRTSNGVNCITQ
jgi:hypothetical protein